MSQVMVFTNLVTRKGNFERDTKKGTLTVLREGITGNFISEVEAPDDPLAEVPEPVNDFRELEVGSAWKPRPGSSKAKSANGEFEWYVFVPADESL